jgi:hypothetical protein
MIKSQSKFVKNLDAIYRDILNIKIDENDSFKLTMDKFYAIMRKWGICQGNWSENGRTCNTAEWNMCYQTFKNHKILALDIWLLINEPPSDLVQKHNLLNVKNLDAIYTDILKIELDENDSFKSTMDKFYAIMRKWGIYQIRGFKNAEWNMCYETFKKHKILALDIWLSLNEPPLDLLAYGREPKRNYKSKKQ